MKQILYFIVIIFALSVRANAATDKPNVIILIADQLRYQSVGYSGDKKAITPRLSQGPVKPNITQCQQKHRALHPCDCGADRECGPTRGA